MKLSTKRIIASATLVSGAYLTHSPNVLAQSSDFCAPVYDETLRGDSSSALRAQIGEYALHGIDVHVQIFEDATDNGINNPHDAENFAENLADQCNWDNDLVNVLISTYPRVYNIYRSGQADADIQQTAVNSAETEFINNLRNQSSSYQADAAWLLEDINPYTVQEAPAQVIDGVNETAPHSDNTNTNQNTHLPVQAILLTLAGLTAGSSLITRTARGLTIKKSAKNALQEAAADTFTKINNALVAAQASLSILPVDDAQELRRLEQLAENIFMEFNSDREKLNATYKEERFRFWPNKQRVLSAVNQLDDLSAKAHEVAEQLNQETEEVQNFIANIDTQIQKFDSLLQKTHSDVEDKQAEGWDIAPVISQLAKYDTSLATIRQLRNDHYVEKPAELIDTVEQEIADLQVILDSLAEDRHKADMHYNQQGGRIADAQHKTSVALNVLNNIRELFDVSCYTDLNNLESQLDELLQQLNSTKNEGEELVGVKSLDALQKANEVNANFDTHTALIDELTLTIQQRLDKLEEIKAQIPLRLEVINGELDAVHNFANIQHPHDVENSTRDRIIVLTQDLERFIRDNVHVEQPKYLLIDTQAAAIKEQLDKLTRQAHAEQREMVQLRDSVVSLQHDARSSLNRLTNYIASNRSDIDSSTENQARNLSVYEATVNGNRSELRDTVTGYNELLQNIESIEQDAKADVQREEQRRVRERREEEARRRREQQRENTASSSFSSYGGGGGSHDSGSW